MKIEFDIELSADEKKQLAAMINVSESKLAKVLPDYAKAALEEYIGMINANKNFTQVAAIQQYRLYLLIKHVYKNTYPTPAEISKLFQTTSSQSSSMLNSAMYKYTYELETITIQVISKLLENAEEIKNEKDQLTGYQVTESNDTVIKHVNSTLESIDGALTGLTKDRGTLSVYNLPIASYQKLADYVSNH
jgi:hypothetical protein